VSAVNVPLSSAQAKALNHASEMGEEANASPEAKAESCEEIDEKRKKESME